MNMSDRIEELEEINADMLKALEELHAYLIDQVGESEGTDEVAALIAKDQGVAQGG